MATSRTLAAFGIAGLTVALAISKNARGAEATSRPYLIELRSGFNTSTDMIGATAAVHAGNRIGAGLGVGLDPWLNPQFAALLRVRPLLGTRNGRRHALLTELAFSQGRYRHVFPTVSCEGTGPCPRRMVSDLARWGHVDLAWETQSVDAVSVRLGAGAGFLLNPSSLYCQVEPCVSTPKILASLTVGAGYAF
jgi:hypothetical protein